MAHESIKDQLKASIAEITSFLKTSQEEKEDYLRKVNELDDKQKMADRDMATAKQALEALSQDDPKERMTPMPTNEPATVRSNSLGRMYS